MRQLEQRTLATEAGLLYADMRLLASSRRGCKQSGTPRAIPRSARAHFEDIAWPIRDVNQHPAGRPVAVR